MELSRNMLHLCWNHKYIFCVNEILLWAKVLAGSLIDWLLIILVLASSQLIGYRLSGNFVPGYWKWWLPARTFAHRHCYCFQKSCLCLSVLFFPRETIWNHLKPSETIWNQRQRLKPSETFWNPLNLWFQHKCNM